MATDIDHERLLTALGLLALVILAYSLFVLQELLVGVFAVVAITVPYLFFVFIQVLDRIATALETLAERETQE